MATAQEFVIIKEFVEKAQRKADKAEGALFQLMVTLKKDLGIDSLEKAEKLLGKLEREVKEESDKFDLAFSEFKETYSSILEGGK